MAFGAAIFLGGVAWYFLSSKSEQVSSTAPVAPIKPKVGVTDIELQTMREINDWIGVLDEMKLRSLFDIPNVLEHNLSFISNNKGPWGRKSTH